MQTITMNKKGETFTIPVTWEQAGYIKVKALTLKDAIRYAEEHIDELEATGGEYVDGSYMVNVEDTNEASVYQKEYIYCLSCNTLSLSGEEKFKEGSILIVADFSVDNRRTNITMVAGKNGFEYHVGDHIYPEPRGKVDVTYAIGKMKMILTNLNLK